MRFGFGRLKQSVLSKVRRLNEDFGNHGYLEPIYQQLFQRELAKYGLPDDYTPLQSAANYSLLFSLLKCVVDAQPANVLELGCGETTRLLNALRDSGAWRGQLVSLEHDEFWHQQVSAEVDTRVIHAPLVSRVIRGHRSMGYDLSALTRPLGQFELVLVDGPNGTPRWSRLACLEFIPAHLAGDFIVIMDDHERAGERETAGLIRQALSDRGTEFWEEPVISNKQQLLIATERFRANLYPRVRSARRAQPFVSELKIRHRKQMPVDVG